MLEVLKVLALILKVALDRIVIRTGAKAAYVLACINLDEIGTRTSARGSSGTSASAIGQCRRDISDSMR